MAEEEKEAVHQEDVKEEAKDPEQSLAGTLSASRTAVFSGASLASEAAEEASAELAEPDFASTIDFDLFGESGSVLPPLAAGFWERLAPNSDTGFWRLLLS